MPSRRQLLVVDAPELARALAHCFDVKRASAEEAPEKLGAGGWYAVVVESRLGARGLRALENALAISPETLRFLVIDDDVGDSRVKRAIREGIAFWVVDGGAPELHGALHRTERRRAELA